MSSFLSFKKKRIFLKILSYISTASLLLTFVILPMQPVVHADIVDLKDMGAAGMITGYGAWNGTSLAFEIYSDISNGVSHAGQLIEGLWNQAYVELGTLPTYQSLSEYYASGIISQYQVYGDTYSQLIINETTARSLDVFWDWVLDKAGLTRNSQGFYTFPSDFTAVPLNTDSFVSVPELTLYGPVYNGDTFTSNTNVVYTVRNLSGGDLYYYIFNSPLNNTNCPVFVSTSSSTSFQLYNQPYLITRQYNPAGVLSYYDGESSSGFDPPLYVVGSNGYFGLTGNFVISYITSNPLPIPAEIISDPSSLGTVSVSLAGPSAETGIIILPDPSDPEYVPQPVTIPTVIPYPPEYAPLPVPVPDPITGDFPENAPDPEEVAESLAEPLVQGAIDGEIVAENPELNPEPVPGPDPDAPVEVITPFLPVVFPSFNFSLSGIWHYVVEWVGTLGSWFSLVFTIWSHLPYAIVVPVYATAVVVIVLGVYKRFFM